MNHAGSRGAASGRRGARAGRATDRERSRLPHVQGRDHHTVGAAPHLGHGLEAAASVAPHDVDDVVEGLGDLEMGRRGGDPGAGEEHERREPVDHGVDAVRVHRGE